MGVLMAGAVLSPLGSTLDRTRATPAQRPVRTQHGPWQRPALSAGGEESGRIKADVGDKF